MILKTTPYGLLTNQVGHVFISMLLAISIAYWISFDWLYLLIVFWTGWEGYQFFFRNGTIKDTLSLIYFLSAFQYYQF